jgi:hypothetical protein
MTSQFVSIITHVVMSRVFKHPIDGLSNVTVSSINSMLGKIPIFDGLKSLGGIFSGEVKDEATTPEADKGKD